MSVAEGQLRDKHKAPAEAGAHGRRDSALILVYGAALALSIAIWFIAIRAPLWLDETGSYWHIKDGISHIWSHRLITLFFPTYLYILWFFTKIFGTSELALRVPSILAMLGAVYLLYLAARELFDRETALTAAVIFCVHPIVIFESIDIRPYAFGMLATNAAVLILLRLRKNNSNRMAALFGFSAAFILYFHYLFAPILPAFVLCFFVMKRGDRRTLWRQFGIGIVVLALAFLPLVSGLHYLFSTKEIHASVAAPKLRDLIWTVAPMWLPFVFAGFALVALVLAAVTTPRRDSPSHLDGWLVDGWKIVVCASLAVIPLLILYGLSVTTPIHLWVFEHCTVAIPGIALCWALAVGCLDSVLRRFRPLEVRVLFCVVLAGTMAFYYYRDPFSRHHLWSWKYSLQVAEQNASVDDAPVLICSPFPESDYAVMPLDSAKSSAYFSPLSYYKLSVPVVPLPMTLNQETIRVGSQFLEVATQKRERFLALAHKPSYETLDWLAQSASGAYSVHGLGTYDGVKILEFIPRSQVGGSR